MPNEARIKLSELPDRYSNFLVKEIYWAAGFIEGEGTFYFDKRVASIRVPQVESEPLKRLKDVFGGNWYHRKSFSNPKHHTQWVYRCDGKRGVGLAMTLYPLMSKKRQAQIKKMLDLWRVYPSLRPKACHRGHEYVDGSYWSYKRWSNESNSETTMRVCKECSKLRYRDKLGRYGKGTLDVRSSHQVI